MPSLSSWAHDVHTTQSVLAEFVIVVGHSLRAQINKIILVTKTSSSPE